MEKNSFCLILNLPAELRLRIYEAALAPTRTVCLTSTRFKRFATNPVLAPALLATCRQIRNEAVDILYDQTICISVDAHDTCWPTISQLRFSQCALEKLQRMFVVLDTTEFFSASFEDVDWTAFSALISLKSLRLAVIHQDVQTYYWSRPLSNSVRELLPNVIERIPKGASVLYGVETHTEEASFLRQTLEVAAIRLNPEIRSSPKERDPEEITRIAQSLSHIQQGCKSGGVEDVFAEYHERRNKAPVIAI